MTHASKGLLRPLGSSHPANAKAEASCAAVGRDHVLSEQPAGGFPCSGPDLLSDLPTLLRFVASVNTLPCEVICPQQWGGFAPQGTLAPPPPANITHNVSSSDKNGFVPLKHEYQKCVPLTEDVATGFHADGSARGRFCLVFSTSCTRSEAQWKNE